MSMSEQKKKKKNEDKKLGSAIKPWSLDQTVQGWLS